MTTKPTAQHTPGPWAPDINGEIWTSTGPTGCFNRRIASVNLEVFDCGANARLIAAAPELLALTQKSERLTGVLTAALRSGAITGLKGDEWNAFVDDARALLAKIEGGANG
jgi:hypothetical protein